jgi:FkbM family methyltransferase
MDGFNKKNPVIFDIGSRDCLQSIEFLKYFPEASIYAFECNTNTIPICKNNIINYPNITLIDKAVNNYDGTCVFYPIDQEKTITSWKDGNPGASSLFKANGKYQIETYIQNRVETPCTRLDTIMNKYNIENVDIIWMDLQGAELLALESFGDKIKNVKYIHTEVSYKPMYEGQVLFNELNDFLYKSGFKLYNRPKLQGWQEDLIYINK